MTPVAKRSKSRLATWLDYIRFTLTGALAGIAIVNTYAMLTGADPSRPAEAVGMASGAVIMTVIIKLLHVV